jgi:hypothetical protein
MKQMLCLLVGMLLSLSASAEKAQDFVALLMSDLEEQYGVDDNDEYGCVTVSPSMMEKMLKMLQSKDVKNDEQIQRILPHVKSMRIFSATKHIDRYNTAATKLLNKNAKSYKPFKASAEKSVDPCVWVRKSGAKVIEMIVLNRKENENFQVINITGDMNKAFVDELLKM